MDPQHVEPDVFTSFLSSSGFFGPALSEVNSTVTSEQEGSRFRSRLVPFCVEFACSPRVCVEKTCMLDHFKLTLGVSVGGCCLYVAL